MVASGHGHGGGRLVMWVAATGGGHGGSKVVGAWRQVVVVMVVKGWSGEGTLLEEIGSRKSWGDLKGL